MDKQANTVLKQLFRLLNPWATATSDPMEFDKLPALIEGNPRANLMAWNALVAGGGMFAASALGKAVFAKINAHKWEKKNKKIVADKVNALHPILAPNYENNPETTESVRKIGLSSLLKQANDGDAPDLTDRALDDLVKFTVGAVPVATALTGALIAPKIVTPRLEDKDEDELDVRIRDKRNELAALQARMIELGLNKKANAVENALTGTGASVLGVLTALLSVGAYSAVDNYLEKNDKNRKIVKALAEVASQNNTNIPQKLSIKLNSDGKPALSKDEQTYLKKLTELADNADVPKRHKELPAPKSEPKALAEPPNDDFSDKLTNIKKDALFS